MTVSLVQEGTRQLIKTFLFQKIDLQTLLFGRTTGQLRSLRRAVVRTDCNLESMPNTRIVCTDMQSFCTSVFSRASLISNYFAGNMIYLLAAVKGGELEKTDPTFWLPFDEKARHLAPQY